MRFAYYIARKLAGNPELSFTKTVVRLAAVAVSISVLVVILSYGILLGFKKEIRDKVSGYTGHVTISNFDLSQGSEHSFLRIDPQLMDTLRTIPEVASVSPFIHKAGILRVDSFIEGIIFKGVGADHDLSFYQRHLLRGHLPVYSDSSDSYDVLLSEHTADILNLDTGDRAHLFFIEKGDVRRRRPKVVGIFNTGLQSFDKQFAIADIRMVQRVVGLTYAEASGYELVLHDFGQLDEAYPKIDARINSFLRAEPITERYETIFQWLEIVDTNVLIIIILMFTVGIINVITVLLILVIERIPMVGLLKAMGAKDRSIRNIFSWQGVFILLSGLILGNLLAFTLAYLQGRYQLIELSAETYYMDAVPFFLPWSYVIGINAGTLLLSYFFTWLPARMIARISPHTSIRFR